MAEAQQVEAEIGRLNQMAEDAFTKAVVGFVTGVIDRRASREVQQEALHDPRLAPRTLDALETALRQAKSFNLPREGESKRERQARINVWREQIKTAMGPVHDVVDDLAHDHAKELAALDGDAFADRWVGFVLGEQPPAPTAPRVEALALRSPRVAARGERVCRHMYEDPGQYLPAPPSGESGNAREARVAKFRNRVDSEVKLLRYAVQYAEARQGRMPSEPNERLRALRLLGEAHPEELSRLRHEVRADDHEQARAGRQARRDGRRAERAASR
ncbi:hypothetical protein ACIQU7_23495 [Streptomyces albidoflavus]